jgi:hypothetical protein
MRMQEVKHWCRAHRKELIVLGSVAIVVTAVGVYLYTVEGGVYIIVQGRPFCIKYVGQTRNFVARRWGHFCTGYYNPSKDWFVRIPIPSIKDALEKFLINVIKPPLNRDYEVAKGVTKGFASGVNVIFAGMTAIRLWRKTTVVDEQTT